MGDRSDQPQQERSTAFLLIATIHGHPNDADVLLGLWAADIDDATVVSSEEFLLQPDDDSLSNEYDVRMTNVVLSGTMTTDRLPADLLSTFWARTSGVVLSHHLVVNGQVHTG